ncbi:MAG: ParB/RepB/Spo0J family partition protein [Planctomycetaceae bacterium]|nr:ParB/RepB/Spo0J family partition protein [Planctomycetaceae bacterium]
MASTRSTLEKFSSNLEESMGLREVDLSPKLSPVPLNRDAGRRPLRNVGRVDINQVIPDPEQPRAEFSDEAIERLADSIREKGQLSAIRVRWSEELSKWIIVAGERRWRATKRAGLPTIDCYFHEGEISKSEILEQQLIENLLREDLQPIEEAKAFSTLMTINNWNGKQLAEALRVPQAKVSRSLALLRLPDDIQEQVAAGVLAPRSAYELSKIGDDKVRRELAEQVTSDGLTRDEAASVVRQRKGKPKQQSRGTRQTFASAGGWKVIVTANRRGSYHEIEEALLDALEEVRLRIANGIQIL